MYDHYLNQRIDIPFIKEFVDIYGNINTEWAYFDEITNIIEDVINSSSLPKKEYIYVSDRINKEIVLKTLAFLFLQSLILEKYINKNETEINKIELIHFINKIYNSFIIFIDFLYVMNLGELNSDMIEEKNIKKLLFRITTNLELKKIICYDKVTVFDEKNKKLKNAKLINFECETENKNLSLLYKIGYQPATIKSRGHVRIIGFNNFLLNTYLISKKKFKKNSFYKNEFIELSENRARTGFYFDKQMIEVVEERCAILKKTNIETDLKNLKIEYAKKTRILAQINDQTVIDNYETDLRLIKNKIKEKQKELSLSIDIWLFDNLIKKYTNYNNKIYFIPYNDFRGRSYLDSVVSPTGNWLFRFIYNFGWSNNLTKNLNILSVSVEVENKIKEIINDGYQNTYAWIFLSIGFKFKSEIVKSNGCIRINEIILKGIESYKKYKKNYQKIFDILDNMESMESIYYITLIDRLIERDYIKRYLIKDTTASVYQHLGKVLIFKNNDALKITNLLDHQVWYDTYEPLINELKKDISAEILNFFCRKSLKIIFFTTKYNIGFKSALNYFLDEIPFIENKETYKKVLSTFAKIFKNLLNGDVEKKLLYEDSIKDLNKKLLNYEEIELEDMRLNFIYYKMKKKEICIFVEKKRYTIVNYEKTNEIDKDKMKIANSPHLIHALDGLYCRRVVDYVIKHNVSIFSIHDAFCVPFDQVDILIIGARESIKINERFEFTSKTNKEVKIESLAILI